MVSGSASSTRWARNLDLDLVAGPEARAGGVGELPKPATVGAHGEELGADQTGLEGMAVRGCAAWAGLAAARYLRFASRAAQRA